MNDRNQPSRRAILKVAAAATAGVMIDVRSRAAGAPLPASAPAGATRSFHLCLVPTAFEADAELLPAVVDAGIEHVWLPGFFYGFWPFPMEQLARVRERIERAGVSVHAINVPLGHPGDALGETTQTIPIAPPRDRWHYATSVDGQKTTGCSIHAPVVAENIDAIQRLSRAGFKDLFLDDDFRLARTPGMIGGCFCDDHRKRFLDSRGFGVAQWESLLGAVRARTRTRELDAWIDFICDELTGMFKSVQAAAPQTKLGNMVMVHGAEKAGIRLSDYRDVPFRVGEEHFHDGSFGSVKGKCDELYSALFHRRYARPELAFSESTAFPSGALSAKNLAAKLVISTIADVRNTMFMSGVVPFPRAFWPQLKPEIARQRTLHPLVAGQALCGPFKHYWGDDARRVGDDRPFSLFLASGVPFEVCDVPAQDGFTFLSGFDARAVHERRLESPGTTFVDEAGLAGGRKVAESFEALMALKHELLPKLRDVPYVVEDQPVVCAWYPDARAVLLWNLSEQPQSLTLRLGERTWRATTGSLEATLMRDVG